MKKSSFARAAEAALIALALCVMAVLSLSVQRLSDESGLAALSAVGGWYRVENGERVSVALPDVFGGGAPVTEELAAEALRDMLPVKDPRRITTDLIMAIVAEYYSVSVEDLKSKRRNREITVPRQIAMYLTRELNGASLPRIGLEFGGRDHTTVIHACDKVAEDMKRDAALKGTIDTLKKRIQGA